MSDNRQPTRPPVAQRRPTTALPYPPAPLPKRKQRDAAAQPAPQPHRRPLTNYIGFTKDSHGRWTFAHHQGKETKPMGMNGYTSADAAYREALALGRLQTGHILLTRDFLDDLYAYWDAADREAQATPRAWELP